MAMEGQRAVYMGFWAPLLNLTWQLSVIMRFVEQMILPWEVPCSSALLHEPLSVVSLAFFGNYPCHVSSQDERYKSKYTIAYIRGIVILILMPFLRPLLPKAKDTHTETSLGASARVCGLATSHNKRCSRRNVTMSLRLEPTVSQGETISS